MNVLQIVPMFVAHGFHFMVWIDMIAYVVQITSTLGWGLLGPAHSQWRRDCRDCRDRRHDCFRTFSNVTAAFRIANFTHHDWNLPILFLHRAVCRSKSKDGAPTAHMGPISNVSPIWAVGGEQKVDNLEGARPSAHCPPSMGDGRWARRMGG